MKLQILTSANGNPTHWFGIACRALRPDHWDAYLFYVRQNGDVEFGMKGQLDVKPQLIPEVASQPVTVRMRVESNSVQTWVNDRPCHYWVDTDREFVRKGDIYLIAYATEVGIHSVEITVKKWYGPLIQFGKRFWKSFVVAGIIVGFIAALLQILG